MLELRSSSRPSPAHGFSRWAVLLLVATLAGLLLVQSSAQEADKDKPQPRKAEPVGTVDEKDLLNADDNNDNWLMYGRTYDAHRYSPLKQINKTNVKQLTTVWTFQTGVLDGFECTPLVIDGIMYITTPWNHA